MSSPERAARRAAAAGGVLARRNPTVKLGLLFATSFTSLFIFDPLTPAMLYGLSLTAVLSLTDIPLSRLLVAHIPFLAFAAGLLMVNSVTRPGTVLWHVGFLSVTEEGLTVGAALAMRTLLIGVLSIGFLLSTDPVDLMTSLHHNARLSSRVTYTLLAGYRMLQEMPSEWETIRNAQAVRTNFHGAGRARERAPGMTRAAFTLLVLAIRKGERISQSLESRGLGLSPRSTWRMTPVTVGDYVMVVACCATFTAVLLVSHGAGALTGMSALNT